MALSLAHRFRNVTGDSKINNTGDMIFANHRDTGDTRAPVLRIASAIAPAMYRGPLELRRP